MKIVKNGTDRDGLPDLFLATPKGFRRLEILENDHEIHVVIQKQSPVNIFGEHPDLSDGEEIGDLTIEIERMLDY